LSKADRVRGSGLLMIGNAIPGLNFYIKRAKKKVISRVCEGKEGTKT